ncbi:hypothetical protein L1765_15455 [Microaerobacter geothermalis]|uniref:hypothetical protein n=1 Tax=Microaerobacter geothermalis TaxID=674972 RepID=UPI001F34BF2B|nr:hypothetical protein [Microaerobacter geothermalis]MCF6093874.1 hypothetical protein [Microaerobacter geothermalis]MCF6095354.1 hypothetical protein [Microaerobacter geothermalis]
MSIPLKPHQSLQSLAAQRVSGFEEPVGTKYQENKKCPPNWKKLVERAAGSTKMERWEMSREII